MELQQYSSHLSRSSTLVSSLSSVIKIEIATPRRTRQNKQKTEQIIFPSHIIYLTDGSKKIEKTGKILACPPIFQSLCARPSSAHLLIWSCHRLANGDLQPLETNDPAREGQQLMARGVTLLCWWDLLCDTGAGLKHLGILVFKRIHLMIGDKFSSVPTNPNKIWPLRN